MNNIEDNKNIDFVLYSLDREFVLSGFAAVGISSIENAHAYYRTGCYATRSLQKILQYISLVRSRGLQNGTVA